MDYNKQKRRLQNMIFEFMKSSLSATHVLDLGDLADHLLSNGVIMLPCTKGTPIFRIRWNDSACSDCENYKDGYYDDVSECTKGYNLFPSINNQLNVCPKHFKEVVSTEFYYLIDDDFFLTMEEAQKALEEGKK